MIDLSHLSQEKRAFLNAHPDLLRSLEKSIPLQTRRIQAREEKLRKGKSKRQRDLHRIDELKRRYDPKLMEIERKVFGEPIVASKLVCPKCGGGDQGNKKNGHAWCMKCGCPLIPKKMLKKWRKLPEVKFAPNALREELHRLNPGLRPDSKEDM